MNRLEKFNDRNIENNSNTLGFYKLASIWIIIPIQKVQFIDSLDTQTT